MRLSRSARSLIHLVVNNSGADSNPALLGVVAANPEIFKTNAQGWAAALNQDQTVNGPGNPAQADTIVTVFGTGFGPLTPEPQDGSILTGVLAALDASAVDIMQAIAVNPARLEVSYAGPAPNSVAGVIQINFRLPKTLNAPTLATPPFEYPLRVLVNGWSSSTFLMAIPK